MTTAKSFTHTRGPSPCLAGNVVNKVDVLNENQLMLEPLEARVKGMVVVLGIDSKGE